MFHFLCIILFYFASPAQAMLARRAPCKPVPKPKQQCYVPAKAIKPIALMRSYTKMEKDRGIPHLPPSYLYSPEQHKKIEKERSKEHTTNGRHSSSNSYNQSNSDSMRERDSSKGSTGTQDDPAIAYLNKIAIESVFPQGSSNGGW